jgi:hypothetical protein
VPRCVFRADIAPPANVSLSRQVAIEKLSYEVLLKVFHHYLHTSPQGWPTLIHICRGWRQIVLTSPLGLHLRLYCTYGTPVLKDLDFWPPFPLVVSYGGYPMHHPPAPEDDKNIIAALKQSDRVSSISLTITNSLINNLYTISEPFPILEELVLLSRDNVQVILPKAFRWGPHLRTLHLTSFPFPSLLQHLSSSMSLVDLHLHEISGVGYFPPDAFANALSELAQLETLSLHFCILPPRRNFFGLPPHPSNHIALPTLKSLKYRGSSTYLDSFVARINAPRLGDFDVTFFGQPTVDASQLGRFIERIETLTSLDQADIQTSPRAISICCSKPGTLAQLKLQISGEQLEWQLDSLTQICDHLSPFLLRVQDLGIYSTQSPSEQAVVEAQQWRDLIHAFGDTKEFRVAGAHTTEILWVLFSTDDAHATSTAVLPTLRNLRVQDYIPIFGPLWEAEQSFITSRRHSGRPVELHIPPPHSVFPKPLGPEFHATPQPSTNHHLKGQDIPNLQSHSEVSGADQFHEAYQINRTCVPYYLAIYLYLGRCCKKNSHSLLRGGTLVSP